MATLNDLTQISPELGQLEAQLQAAISQTLTAMENTLSYLRRSGLDEEKALLYAEVEAARERLEQCLKEA